MYTCDAVCVCGGGGQTQAGAGRNQPPAAPVKPRQRAVEGAQLRCALGENRLDSAAGTRLAEQHGLVLSEVGVMLVAG